MLDVVEDIIGPNILVHSTSIFCKYPHDPAYVSSASGQVLLGPECAAPGVGVDRPERQHTGQRLHARLDRGATRNVFRTMSSDTVTTCWPVG